MQHCTHQLFSYAVQRICPPDAVPAASAAEERLCAEDFAEAQLGVEGTFFDACVNTAANTECKDTVLAGAGGSRIIPDWCIDYSSTVDFPTFNCSGQVDDAPRYVYCAESSRTADCGNTLCQGGATVCPQRSYAGTPMCCLAVQL